MFDFLKRFPLINGLNNNKRMCVIVRHCAGHLYRPIDWASPQWSKDLLPLLTAAGVGSLSSSGDRCWKSPGQKRKYSCVFTTAIAWFYHPWAMLLAWIAAVPAAWLWSVCVILPWFQIKPSSCFVSTAVSGRFKTCSWSLCCFDGWHQLVCTAAAGAEQHLCRIFGSQTF